ncbi:peroxisomal biogenesis factor 11-domain-containing protein [Podospora fimiseda]|uniref:Peroxisomal biogenesis factor 11-domain-containing protein n=1 Tax=Podospora fimiseda TaxID=252190 RepID=A0AAN7BW75_9PEZI|nr:peroxisomal biogenesis factor 11-domain-containing protein [Podospora fimiseda]
MVADTLIYHPAVSHYLKFVATTVGRDKLLRTLQYFARFYAWYLLRTNKPQSSISPWEQMKKQFGLVRKVLRAGKNVEHFKAAALAADNNTMDPVLKYMAVGRQLGYAGYLSMDLLTLLDATGIKKSVHAKKLQTEAFRFWAVGIACSIVAQVYTLYGLKEREKKIDKKEGEGVVSAKTIAKERAASQLQLTSDLCDITVPLSALNWVGFDDGFVGLAGTVSSLIGVYTHSLWVRSVPHSSIIPSSHPAPSLPTSDPKDLGLSILGLGVQYPPHSLSSNALEVLAKKYHPDSPAMQKVLAINRYTGIDSRSSIGTPDHPLVNKPSPPTIAELHQTFFSDGIPLAVTACQKALSEAHLLPSAITHMVSTTCTDSSNPGYDHYVAKSLDLPQTTQKVLLHGVGCAGGLTALRTAANLCLGNSFRGLPARILVLALEVSTTMVRSELESIAQLQQTRIGVCLFSDCASAVVLSNNIQASDSEPLPPPIYSLLSYHHDMIPDTEEDLGFDIDPLGWKVILSPRVPSLTKSILLPSYKTLISSSPKLPEEYAEPKDFDWAMHPGGATILTGAESALGITPQHMRASYATYVNNGNSSSATIFSVLDRLRKKEMDGEGMTPDERGAKEMIVAAAFGPGICVEMCLLKRNLDSSQLSRKGMETPPESSDERSEGGEREGEGEEFISQALESVELD